MIEVQVTSKLLGKALADIEPYSMGPLVHFAAFLVSRLEEHLKKILPVLFGDANSIVLHSELDSDKALVRYLILLEF